MKIFYKIYIKNNRFHDTFKNAYAATVYMRVLENNEEYYTLLLITKAKIPPINKKTIALLEFNEALLLINLMNHVITHLILKLDNFIAIR